MSEHADRLVVLDLETTGLSDGNRVVEIGCVEIIGRTITGREYQQYVDPQREVEPDALKVHGISNEQLEGEPKFSEVLDALLEFVADAEVLIHNAKFDLKFLNYEMSLAQDGRNFEDCCRKVTDTLEIARRKFPGRSSLDQLCDIYQVDRAERDYHGALLDCQLLAKVYLHMTGGQIGLGLNRPAALERDNLMAPEHIELLAPTEAERAAHEAMLSDLDTARADGQKSLWRRVLDGVRGG